jgi:hypothetical protein
VLLTGWWGSVVDDGAGHCIRFVSQLALLRLFFANSAR